MTDSLDSETEVLFIATNDSGSGRGRTNTALWMVESLAEVADGEN